MSHIVHTTNLVQFFEDDVHGEHKVNLKADANLTEDYYLTLPSTSGTLATQGYVDNATGGAFLGLSSDFTNDDATSTPQNVTGMSFTVEANRNYWVEGAMLWYDVGSSGNQAVKLTVPSGASYTFYQNSVSETGFITHDSWIDDQDSGYGNGYMGNEQGGNTWTKFHGILRVGATAGTVQLQFTNMTGDSSQMGLRKGSFIRVIDPQA